MTDFEIVMELSKYSREDLQICLDCLKERELNEELISEKRSLITDEIFIQLAMIGKEK